VGNGSVVDLELAGNKMTYVLGSRDIAVATHYDVISPESPIGAAIIGGKSGDEVSYKAPNGKEISVRILDAKPLQ
jgi:transcription elongation factor GreA